jgi:hypothetical protein
LEISTPKGLVPYADRPAEKKTNPARVLRSGVLLLSLGVVLCLAINAAGGHEGALFGLIPATLGLANLAYAFVLFRKEREAAGEKVRSFLPPP